MRRFLAFVTKSASDNVLIRIVAAVAVGWLLYISWANSMVFPVLDVCRGVAQKDGASHW